jgi:hypothetical protein
MPSLGANDGWRRVDRGMMAQLQVAYVSDSMAPACVRAIENRLLSSGILYTKKDYSLRPSDDFQSHINQHFVTFVGQALRQLTVMGYCFFLVDDNIPRVIPLDMADVRFRINTDEFRVEMGIFKADEDKPRDDIYSIIDTPVDTNGQMQSVMSSYIRTRSLYESFMRNALQADRLNACPPIYTQTQTDHVFDERNIMNTGELENAPRIDPVSLIGSDVNARLRINVNAHTVNERFVRALNSRTAEDMRLEKTDQGTGLAHFDSTMDDLKQPILPLPLDARIASAPRPTARTDIVSLMKHFETLACVAFGVNSESVGADVRSGGHLGAQTLDRASVVTQETTQKWSRLLEPTLVEVFKLVWGEEEDITVVFPSTLPSATIEHLYTARVLSHQSYISYMSKTVQMPAKAFEKQDYRGGEELKA